MFKLKKYDEAITEADYCLERNFSTPSLLTLKGICLYNLQELEKAEQSLTSSLRVNAHQENAYETLMFIYALQGENKKLIGILSDWIKLLPQNSVKSQLIKEQIRKLQSES